LFRPSNPITQFLACWFIPGIIFLSSIKHKHGHYPIPILPPMVIACAAGMFHFINWRRKYPPHIALTIAWTVISLAAGGAGAWLMLHWKFLPTDALRQDLAIAVGAIALACIVCGLLEYFRQNVAQLACIIIVAVGIEVSLQRTVVPATDEYRSQAELAERAAGEVPDGQTIYLLGRREEEHEAEYAYYLREPMQRCDDFAFFPTLVSSLTRPLYAITPAVLIPDLQTRWTVTVLDKTSKLRPGETEDDHLSLVRLDRNAAATLPAQTQTTIR
jgi:hypothetical protein